MDAQAQGDASRQKPWSAEEVRHLMSLVPKIRGGSEPILDRSWEEIAQCMKEAQPGGSQRSYAVPNCKVAYVRNIKAHLGLSENDRWSDAELEHMRPFLVAKMGGVKEGRKSAGWPAIAANMQENFGDRRFYNSVSCKFQWLTYLEQRNRQGPDTNAPTMQQAIVGNQPMIDEPYIGADQPEVDEGDMTDWDEDGDEFDYGGELWGVKIP